MEETNKNSCGAKETLELEAKKNNEGTEMPDVTTTTSHLPEDYANLEVMTAWQKKENDEKFAKLKVFGEKSTKNIFFQLAFHCHEWANHKHFIELHSVSEKKVLPGAVLFAGLVYAAVAIAFYCD